MYVYTDPMRRKKEDAEKTADFLLDSAMKLFIRRGYSAITLEQIATEAKVTRGAFYHHFSSKEELLNKLIKRERDSFEGGLEKIFRAKLAPEKHLEKLVFYLLDNFYSNKRFNRFIQFTWFKVESSMLEGKFYYQGATNERLVKEVAKIIRKGQGLGVFRKDSSANVDAMGITSMILGMYRLHFQYKKGMTHSAAKRMFAGYLGKLRVRDGTSA
jgi:TetR/AcrR family acrAB operon transcriptional repressor